ncbi:hypothetical protein DFH09DRAFT_1301886 [Mycena vulgaris]|nr:hypothetical protein DFH09DRAFT_1301886 [Mycena vulgaris]
MDVYVAPTLDILPARRAQHPANGEHTFIFVDDDTIVTTGPDFRDTHKKIQDVMVRPEGVDIWAADHNAKFGPAKYQMIDASRRRVAPPFQPRKRVPEPRFGMKRARTP